MDVSGSAVSSVELGVRNVVCVVSLEVVEIGIIGVDDGSAAVRRMEVSSSAVSSVELGARNVVFVVTLEVVEIGTIARDRL